jgi:hypothetical protein
MGASSVNPQEVFRSGLQLYRTLSRMGRQAKQGEIGVVIDGKYYGITEYIPE